MILILKTTSCHNYYVYITTNKNKTVLYTGVTNNLSQRINQHQDAAQNNSTNFAARYNAYHLIYWEHFTDIKLAIAREKEINGWKRYKKIVLIGSMNPEWNFLNNDLP